MHRWLFLPGALALAAFFVGSCAPTAVAPGNDGGAGGGDAGIDAGDAGSDSAHPCPRLRFIGDPAKPIEMELVAMNANQAFVTVADGDSVAIIEPPQGGTIIFAGVRVTNVDPCAAKLTGYLRDETTSRLQLASLIVNLDLTADASDGWAQSTSVYTSANVSVCPNNWSNTNIDGSEYELGVTLTDRENRTATKTARVVPACTSLDFSPDDLPPATVMANCTCRCKAGYVLGNPCTGGGGTTDGGTDAGEDGGP